MRSDERLLKLADLAESQWGLLTSAQASELGISAQRLKRLADQGLIVRIRHGVYRLAGSPESVQEPIRAEWLALEPKRLAAERLHDSAPAGVVSHRSAAKLRGLGDLDADYHEFTVPRRRDTRSPDVRFRIGTLDRRDWDLVDGLPVTRPLRTVVDLASGHTDGGHLASIVRDAILTGDTTREELAEELRPYAHHYGVPIGAGTELVDTFIEQAGVPESAVSLADNTLRQLQRRLSFEHLPRRSDETNALPIPWTMYLSHQDNSSVRTDLARYLELPGVSGGDRHGGDRSADLLAFLTALRHGTDRRPGDLLRQLELIAKYGAAAERQLEQDLQTASGSEKPSNAAGVSDEEKV